MPEIHLPDPELTDGVVRLRAPELEDMPDFARATNDPAVLRWMRMPPGDTTVDAYRWLGEQPGRRERGEGMALLITDARTGQLLGNTSLVHVDWSSARAELGYFVASWARGQGVATRALRLLSGWVFDALQLGRVELLISPENPPSLRVAERAGFTREGLLRSFGVVKGTRHDFWMYSRLPTDP